MNNPAPQRAAAPAPAAGTGEPLFGSTTGAFAPLLTPPTAPQAAAAATLPSSFWWRASTQRMFFVWGPIVSIVLFMVVMVSVLWYLQRDEVLRERDDLRRDTEWTQQRIRSKLADLEDHLGRIAREMSAEDPDVGTFRQSSDELLREHPMLAGVALVGAEARLRFVNWRGMTPNPMALKPGDTLAAAPSRGAFDAARTLQTIVYSRPYPTSDGISLIEMHGAIQRRGYFGGTVMVVISLPQVLRFHLPADSPPRYAFTLLDSSGNELASSAAETLTESMLKHEVAATPNGGYLYLRGTTFRTTPGLAGNALFWIVIGLSGLSLWVIGMSWLQVRRRFAAQQQLMQEANFRRAMENSMSTGMRSIDLQGRITYVNPAFCRMTGYSEAELVGQMPPYSYWPPERTEEMRTILEQTLRNEAPPSGYELTIRRKDGSMLDARMYVSPLLDSKGRQFGYMASITDITEPKRIREQLASSQERFTTVLEGLDAAVSVMALGDDTLLFTNRTYRNWFGNDHRAHLQLAGDPSEADSASSDHADSIDSFAGLPADALTRSNTLASETYVPQLDRWFDVRHRYLRWVDGRLVQMLIATDISDRRRAEEKARIQEERAEKTSRLITMGEMASSLAHELNQPLTAINNYCVGIIARVRSNRIDGAALEEALQKTAHQAQRAAGIIRRIREFVKKSEPIRAPVRAEAIVDAALELADLELKKHNVRFERRIEPGLPELHVDRILIEQVLLNLIKNGAEAVDAAGRPYGQRWVRLAIRRCEDCEVPQLLFEIRDSGPGLPEGLSEKLFESFYSTKAEGLGIGLNICRSIVEFHQGRLWAENDYNLSTPGNGGKPAAPSGCTFRFTLPIMASADPPKPRAVDDSTVGIASS